MTGTCSRSAQLGSGRCARCAAGALRIAIGLACVWLAARPSGARADALWVHVAEGACPDAALLEQKLAPLLPDTELWFGAGAPQGAAYREASVEDSGDGYAIAVGDSSRSLGDPARDCAERARVAAVFIALNVQGKPEQVGPPPPQPEPEPKPEAGRQPEAEPELPAPPPRSTLGLRLFGDGVYAPAPERAAFGGGAGAWLAHGAWRAAFTAGALSPAQLPLEPAGGVRGTVSLLRVPLVLSASYVLHAGPLELGPSAGLVLDLLLLRGRDVMRPQSELRASPGAQLAAEIGLRVAPSARLLLRAHATGFARSYGLEVDPLGRLGRTPRLWLGGSLALDFHLH